MQITLELLCNEKVTLMYINSMSLDSEKTKAYLCPLTQYLFIYFNAANIYMLSHFQISWPECYNKC